MIRCNTIHFLNPLLKKWSKTKDCNSVATLVSRSSGAFWLHLLHKVMKGG